MRIDSDRSIVEARQRGRHLAESAGFGVADAAVIATAITELAYNTLTHAKACRMTVTLGQQDGRLALTITATDQGPAPDSRKPSRDEGESSSLDLGLPGVKRLMDEFAVASAPGRRTTVTTTKWRT